MDEGVAVPIATISSIGGNEGCLSSWRERGHVYKQSMKVWPGLTMQGQASRRMFCAVVTGRQALPMSEEP